jgi:ubiquinone/menaquinone biosynthesis C-methylase UbiE
MGMPFPEATFDLVVSSFAIHRIKLSLSVSRHSTRRSACSFKPGGSLCQTLSRNREWST